MHLSGEYSKYLQMQGLPENLVFNVGVNTEDQGEFGKNVSWSDQGLVRLKYGMKSV